MIEFLTANLANIAVFGIILAAVILAANSVVKSKKASPCGQIGCSGCGSHSSCQFSEANEKTDASNNHKVML